MFSTNVLGRIAMTADRSARIALAVCSPGGERGAGSGRGDRTDGCGMEVAAGERGWRALLQRDE
jgi:hypothetical protein